MAKEDGSKKLSETPRDAHIGVSNEVDEERDQPSSPEHIPSFLLHNLPCTINQSLIWFVLIPQRDHILISQELKPRLSLETLIFAVIQKLKWESRRRTIMFRSVFLQCQSRNDSFQRTQ